MRAILLALIPVILASPLVPLSPLLNKRQEDLLPGRFIIKLHDGVSEGTLETVVAAVSNITGTDPKDTYNIGAFKGLSVSASDDQLNAIRALGTADIQHVEQDSKVYVSTTQTNPPWGLARISHVSRSATTYDYDSSAGAGTYAYIIDTGIRTTHSEFGGRATWGANYAGDGSNTDGHGHGTHVAGTTGGTTYGVAKSTNLIAVKVLNSSGSGTTSGVISGIQWAVNDATSKGRIGKAVANLSLGGSYSSTLNNAATSAVNSGLFLAVAAGNDGVSAANSSPASATAVFTVGATDSTDTKASWSNYGSLLDIFAPGVSVLSAWNTGDSSTNTISGTSMATPHITGLAAYLLGLEGAQTPAVLSSRIQSLSTKNVVTSAGTGSPNYLAFNGYTS